MTERGFDRRLAELIRASPHGLVSAGERERLDARHVPEARALAEWLGRATGRWMDLGTGGGLPGLVLADRLRGAEWVLMDARAKKAREVERFAEELGVPCAVVVGRAEALAREAAHRERYRGVVARAVAPLRVLTELARGFLEPEGRLVAVKGTRWEQEVAAASEALRRTGMRVERVDRLGVRESRVVELRAVGHAPEEVPRRAGVPQKRPW